jgi:hypothetical protein
LHCGFVQPGIECPDGRSGNNTETSENAGLQIFNCSKEYSNLYAYSKGKGYVKLARNGKTYPTNPSLAPLVNESVVKDKY